MDRLFDALSELELYIYLGGAAMVLVYAVVFILVRAIQILRTGA